MQQLRHVLSCLVLVGLVAIPTAALPALEGFPPAEPLPLLPDFVQPPADGVDGVEGVEGGEREAKPQVFGPGRAQPIKAAPAIAYEVRWDDYISYIVIEAAGDLRRRAWVSTHEQQSLRLAVSYVGSAFIDKHGLVHIDCRKTKIHGPQAELWSPDSFALGPNGAVRVIDDKDRANVGRVIKHYRAVDGQRHERKSYWQWLTFVRAMVSGQL